MRNQIMTNPAAAGVYDFLDITVGGRYQWAGFDNAPMTAYLYGSKVLNSSKSRYNPSLRTSRGPIRSPEIRTGKLKHAIGGQVVADEYGAFRKISFSGTYAIHLPISRKFNMSFGTKVGISNNTFLQERATVLTQMSGYSGPSVSDPGYDAFIANQSSLNYMDLGMGFYIYSKALFAGLSVDQLTTDLVRFGSGTANFDPNMHFQAIAGYRIPLNRNLNLIPSMLVKYMKPAPVSVEASLQLEYQEWLWFGFSYRHTDAVIFMLGGNISQKFKFGYSFDYSLSQFSDFSNGSHELVLGIMIGR